ncbi:MAG: asparaginase domain-containing protein [Synergistaceae bacterium]|nr:asparaginase domain-containing protein [Synergistaceae bacterium]
MESTPKLALVVAGDFSGESSNAEPVYLVNALPKELAEQCQIIEWSSQPSNYYSMQLMLSMLDMLETLVEQGYSGILVMSGSGVMEEMAYMADLLWQHSEPLIFVNLMVRGRADLKQGLANLHCAVLAALSDMTKGRGVLVCSSSELFAASEVVMADPISPDNAFQSLEKGSVGKMLNGDIKFFRDVRRTEFLARRPEAPAQVDILWASLGGGESMISSLSKSKEIEGLVLAGFGLGSVPPTWMPHIRNLLRRRIPVAVVSRCSSGEVGATNDFEGGFKKLTEMGVISGGKTSPYHARIRMSLGLGAGLTERGLSLYLLNQPVSEDTPILYK